MRRSGADAVPHAEEVDVDDALELLGLVLVEAGHAAGAGVVEDGVQPAEGSGRGVEHLPDGVGVPDVGGERHAAHLLGYRAGSVCVDVDDANLRSLGCEAAAGGAPDARATTRHDRLPSVEDAHGPAS